MTKKKKVNKIRFKVKK